MAQSATYRPPLLRRPSAAGGVNNVPGRCPFLGTPADPGTALAFPSEANHCFRSRFPIPISSIHQENYCLSHQYETCPVYRQYSANEQPERAEVVPVAAIAVGTAAVGTAVAGTAVAGTATVDAPESPRWMGANVASATAPPVHVAAGMALGAGRAPVAYNEPIHPDFQNDAAMTARPARSSGIEPRSVLLGLLLLAMLALAGWAVLTFLGGRDRAGSQGAIVTLPTLAATVDMSVGQTDGAAVAVGADAEATATALGAAGATPTAAEATATTDSAAIDSVAATATALFAGASATAECRAPDWWVPYVTQAGDTVESLAAARGLLPEEIIVANCLASPDLTPGLELRLPPVGVIVLLPVATATATPAATTTTRPNRPTPTFPAIFATPPLIIIFPTPSFPIVVVPTPEPLVPEPGDPTSPAPRPTSVPRPNATSTPPTLPTSTPPIFGPTSTPPIFGATSTPPAVGATSTPPTFGTVQPTKTPPGPGGNTSAP